MIKRRKKGEMIAQPFIIILILIIMVFTLTFGFKMVKNLMGTQEKVKYADFKTDLTENVNQVYNSNEGTTIVFSKISRNYKPLIVPKSVKEVCIDGNKVSFGYYSDSGERYSKFTVEKLKGSGCIAVSSGQFSFTLTNTLVSGGREAAVLITKNEP